MKEKIEFPERWQIEWWVSHLKSTDPLLDLKLPEIDEKWYDDICNVIVRLQFSFVPQDIHTLAATLFYNIDKRHDVIDGNKRSSIVVVYLFYLVNGYLLLKSAKVKDLAKKVASSHGHKQKSRWINKIRNQLSKNVVKIGDFVYKKDEFDSMEFS